VGASVTASTLPPGQTSIGPAPDRVKVLRVARRERNMNAAPEGAALER